MLYCLLFDGSMTVLLPSALPDGDDECAKEALSFLLALSLVIYDHNGGQREGVFLLKFYSETI